MMRTKHTYMLPSFIEALRGYTLKGDLQGGVFALANQLGDECYIARKADQSIFKSNQSGGPPTAEETEMLQDMLEHMLARTDLCYTNGADIRAAFEQGAA